MRKLFIILTALVAIGKASAQVTMPADQKFFKHSYYKLLDKDSLQISFLKSEDRKLLPPLDSIVKPYMYDYQRNIDTAKVEITARRVEYHFDEHRAFVFFAPIIVNEYQFVDGKVYTIKQGKDTVSITGKLSNGRPYRVRFIIDFMKDMLKYGGGNLEALVVEKRSRTGELKKEEGGK
jgi:hypothetical protein